MNPPGPPPIWRPLPGKLRAYEAAYWLNRSFQATLLSLERLEQLGIFRLEYLNEYKVRIEHTRAEANEELIDTLHEQEMDDSAALTKCNAIGKNSAKTPMTYFSMLATAGRRSKNKSRNCRRAWNVSSQNLNERCEKNAADDEKSCPAI